MYDGDRKCTRSGFGDPSLATKHPSSRAATPPSERLAVGGANASVENFEVVDAALPSLSIIFSAVRRHDAGA